MGVLHRGTFHPYEIRRRLTQAMIECFTDVDVGTLYYAVRQLAECDLLAAMAHQRVARGGMRTSRIIKGRPFVVGFGCLAQPLQKGQPL